jgi:hypothetical protein
MLEISLLLIEFAQTVPSEIHHVQCKTNSAVIPYYKLTGKFKSEYSH